MKAFFKLLDNLKLSIRLNLITILVLGLLLVIIAVVLNTALTALTERTGRQRVREEAKVIQSHLAEVERRLGAEAKVVATTPELIEAVAAHDLAGIHTQMLVSAAPFAFDKIEILDAKMDILASYAVAGDAHSAGEEKLISLALLGISKTALMPEHEAAGHLQLSAVVPFKDRTGALIGALLVGRSLNDDLLATLNFNRERVHLVLLYQGQAVAHHVADLSSLDRDTPPDSPPPNIQASFPQLTDPQPFQKISTGQTYVADYFLYDTLDQHPYSVAYLPLLVDDEIDAAIAILLDLSDLNNFQKSLTRSLTGLFVVVMVATMGIMALFFRHSIAVPLRQLGAAAGQMTAGNLSARAGHLASKSEIGLLAISFDQMASQLQQTLDNLEQRVTARTAELEVANRQLSQEVAERKLAEYALRDSEARFRRVTNSISDHVYMTEFSAEGQPVNGYISPNVSDLTGYPAEMLMADWGFWPTVIIHPDDQPLAADQAQRLFQGQASEIEYRLLRADGQEVWVRDSGRVEKDPDTGQFVVYGVVSDITARKQAEEALAQARDQALEASRLKTQLLANVSHDLRTPLNAILGYTEMLQVGIYGQLSPSQREAIAEIIDSTGQLLNFVNNLLNQAQIESGKIVLRSTPFTPIDLLETATAIHILAEAKDITLAFHVAPGVPSPLYGDIHWLRQILLNLVGNAIKFTEPGGTVNASICRPDERHWALQVADTGCGIPAEAQDYIFEVFRQVDGTATRLHGGSGVGLAIVKQLATLMGGNVSLSSQVGQGSTFTVHLPLNSVAEKPYDQTVSLDH